MKRLPPFLALAQIGLLVLILTLLCSPAAEASDGVYACWKVDGELVMSGYFHPAAVAGGPLGGPGLGLTIEIGEGCDKRVGLERRFMRISRLPTPTPTPTSVQPLPTADCRQRCRQRHLWPLPRRARAHGECGCKLMTSLAITRIVTEDDWNRMLGGKGNGRGTEGCPCRIRGG